MIPSLLLTGAYLLLAVAGALSAAKRWGLPERCCGDCPCLSKGREG